MGLTITELIPGLDCCGLQSSKTFIRLSKSVESWSPRRWEEIPKPSQLPIISPNRLIPLPIQIFFSTPAVPSLVQHQPWMMISVRRMSTGARKVAPKMAAALGSSDNRTQAILARLDALENDNAAMETAQQLLDDDDDDDDASLDDDDQVYQKKQSKGTKRKTRQAKALENAKRA